MDVVVIDDNPVNLTLLKHLVRKLPDAHPVGFEDAEAGLKWCLNNMPDLIVVDYMMPACNGIEFVEHLRASPLHVDLPIIMVTASHDDELRYRALEQGCTDFLRKPIDHTEFLARSRNMLMLRRSQRALAERAHVLADEVWSATEQIRQREHEIIVRLSRAAEYRDPETGAHLQRMALYSRLIGTVLDLSPSDCDLVYNAAPMHDVGKVGTPDAILLKPGRLDEAELVIMRQHARIGYDILKDSVSPLLQAAAVIALTHHEKFDGTGYPQGLAGTDIPLFGRIVAVADVFDALTSARPYKPAWEADRAVEYLQAQRGGHFDPDCVDAMLSRLEEVELIRLGLPDKLIERDD